ncbi:hypothetical protein BCR32DRAFT_329171 [Anaeromyces robustus]|uniref:N-acetyltransferase domain-containing protein n=1 Tax=Anaeromyces robustus TaxID=1754192 RepID=A0A1Y1WUK6_9FUNG|nr:hypothetical protein BCR32DRAFT_329171 [Anaeromyces robustus]|eukprot:ORX76824.1 hypothetical protein BCR32DRAFT_329171 [Anaeromyces robustus]
MDEKYIFRKIKKEEVSTLFNLILSRMKWMDEKNIDQWNTDHYDKRFPQSYYEEEQQQGNLYVLVDAISNEILSGAVLLEEDERWGDDNEPSLYIHNLVSNVNNPGIGRIFLEYIENYAKSKGKIFLRLDSPVKNPKLGEIYEKQGFVPTGDFCILERYKGVLRQKII